MRASQRPLWPDTPRKRDLPRLQCKEEGAGERHGRRAVCGSRQPCKLAALLRRSSLESNPAAQRAALGPPEDPAHLNHLKAEERRRTYATTSSCTAQKEHRLVSTS